MEMLAIIRGLEEWRHYLEDTRHPVEIWTNHKNLEYFQVAQKLNRRQARWPLIIYTQHKPRNAPKASIMRNESLSEGLTNNLCRPKARNKKEAKGING
jgi:hypothetical protein